MQDGSGGIWKLDLSFSHTSQAPEKLASFHAGPIASCDVSPVAPFVASIAHDGRVRVYNYEAGSLVARAQFNKTAVGGTALLWVPREADAGEDAKCRTLLAGFADGVLRVLHIAEQPVAAESSLVKRDRDGIAELLLVQALKPHHGALTALALDVRTRLLATAVRSLSLSVYTVFFHLVYN